MVSRDNIAFLGLMRPPSPLSQVWERGDNVPHNYENCYRKPHLKKEYKRMEEYP